jgi:phosphoadenosine phosphosulfate reductase
MTPYYPPCYALVSGGKDGLSAAKCLADCGKLKGCVALDTGISTPDWRDAVEDNCKHQGWSLEVYKTPCSYEALVEKYGFPGPSKHTWFMSYLKGRGVRQFKAVHPDAVLASGVRQTESARRALTTKPVGMFEGAMILAPIFDMPTAEVWKNFRAAGFVRAPAYSTLQISGDCLCGAFARETEPAALAHHYPNIWKRIEELQAKVKPLHPTRWQWGWGCQKARVKKGQDALVCVECGDTDEAR